MTSRTLSGVSKRIRTAVFAELQVHIDRVTARGGELIPLHIGDTHLPPPEGARRVLGQFEPDDVALHRYGETAGLAPLRSVMARVLRQRGVDLDPATEIL